MQCVDITFTDDMSEVAEVNETNCINSTDIGFALMFSTTALRAGAGLPLPSLFLTLFTATVVGVLGGL